MTNRPFIQVPALRVVLDTGHPAGELTEYVLQPDGRDVISWEMTASRRGWPSRHDADFLCSAVVAWSALKRADAYSGDLDRFLDQLRDVAPASDEEKDSANDGAGVEPEAVPTVPGLGTGS